MPAKEWFVMWCDGRGWHTYWYATQAKAEAAAAKHGVKAHKRTTA